MPTGGREVKRKAHAEVDEKKPKYLGSKGG